MGQYRYRCRKHQLASLSYQINNRRPCALIADAHHVDFCHDLEQFCREVFAQVDAIATPTIPTNLPTLAETDIDHGPPGTEQKFLAVSINTRPFNYLGLPGVSAPCGLDPNGCPIGLHIAGRPFAEARILKAADAFQRDTDWHRRLPPILTQTGASA